MRVIYNQTGQMGDIPDNMYDPSQFTQVQDNGSQNTPETQAKSTMMDSLKQAFDPANLRSVVKMPFSLLGTVDDYLKYNTGDDQAKQQAMQSYAQHYQDLANTQKMFGFAPPDSRGGGKGYIGQFNPGQFAKKTLAGASEAASYAVPYGKGATLTSRALVPGAVQGVLGEVAQDNPTLEGAATKATTGAATAGVLDAATRALGGILNKGGEGADQLANNVTKSQYNLTKAESKALRPDQFVDQLGQYGIRNADQAQQAASMVTGKNGILTQITHDALENANKVPLDGMGDVATQAMGNANLVTGGIESKNLGIIQKGLKSIEDGDPQKTFSLVQDWETMGNALRNKSDLTGVSKDLGQVYLTVADELKNRLFNDAAKNVSLGIYNPVSNAEGIIVPETLNQLNDISPELAQKVANAKSIQEIRSLAAPFVGASKAADATAEKTMSQFGQAPSRMIDTALGVGTMLHPQVAIPLAAKKILDTNMGKTAVANGLGGVSDLLQSAGNGITNPAVQQVIQQAAGHAIPGSVGNTPSAQGSGSLVDPYYRADNTQGPMQADVLAAETANPQQSVPTGQQQMQIAQQGQDLGPVDQLITRDEASQLMMQDMAKTGGRNLDKIKAFYEFANPNGSMGKTNQTTMAQLMQVAQAEQALNQVENGLGNVGLTGPIGGLFTKATTGANPEAAALSSDREAIAHNVARALYSDATGRINENDIDRALKLIPDITETAATRAAKLRDLRAMLDNKKQILALYPEAFNSGALAQSGDLGDINNLLQ